MDNKIIGIAVNRIRTPDGTILQSFNRHDYKTHLDANGEEYMVDGGMEYLRRNKNKEDYQELSLYENGDFEEIRKYHSRGSRGKDGRQPLKYIPLCEMSNGYLKSVIDYYPEGTDNVHMRMIKKEIDYRKLNNINIED